MQGSTISGRVLNKHRSARPPCINLRWPRHSLISACTWLYSVHHTGIQRQFPEKSPSIILQYSSRNYVCPYVSNTLLSHFNYFSFISWQSAQTTLSIFEPKTTVVGTLNFPMAQHSSRHLHRDHMHKDIIYPPKPMILDSKMESAVQCRVISVFPCPLISTTKCGGHRMPRAIAMNCLQLTQCLSVWVLI